MTLRVLVMRVVHVIVHNWPLKVAAIALATFLYAGLVASQDTNTLTGPVTVTTVNQPSDTVVTNQPLRDVQQIRYIAPADVPRLRVEDFKATVDLTNVQPNGEPTSVNVTVTSIYPQVTIVEVTPRQIQVVLDTVQQKTVPVRVEQGQVPSGVTVGTTTVDPAVVKVSGPATLVDQVVAARVIATLDPSGLNVDSDLEPTPIDGSGNVVTGVDVEPQTVHVTIPLFTDKQTRTLPVNPIVTGSPAPGFRIASIQVDPQTVLVEGDGDQLASLAEVDTAPVALFGATSDVTQTVSLALPTGVVPAGVTSIKVTVTVEPVTETRTYTAGLRLDGREPGYDYQLSVDRVLMTLYGSVAELDQLSSVPLVVGVNVAGLGAGRHELTVVPSLPTGVTVAAQSPETVTVLITPLVSPSPATPGPSATPTPAPTPTPTPGSS
jgi:YbbR domain-containing protein